MLYVNLRVESFNIENALDIPMAFSLSGISRHGSRNTSLSTTTSNSNSCSYANCTLKPISRCTRCLESYCYNHTYGHVHTIENFEIL